MGNNQEPHPDHHVARLEETRERVAAMLDEMRLQLSEITAVAALSAEKRPLLLGHEPVYTLIESYVTAKSMTLNGLTLYTEEYGGIGLTDGREKEQRRLPPGRHIVVTTIYTVEDKPLDDDASKDS